MADDDQQPGEGAQQETVDQLPEEWKPEPREWTWKDVFTAPMLAFKPTCMVISVITLLLMGLFGYVWFDLLYSQAGESGAKDIQVVGPIVQWAGYALLFLIFSLGATLVSIFMKADLLDDEFLSLKEALGQYKGRIAAAAAVPIFLVLVLAGFNLFLYVSDLVGSLPVVGPTIYAVLYPLGFLLALLILLLGIGVVLAIFVAPAVVAIRRHGWFDNVIDTFEAVGTKPHILVGNLLLVLLMMVVALRVSHGAMTYLDRFAYSDNLYSDELKETETLALQWRSEVTRKINWQPYVQRVRGLSDAYDFVNGLVPWVPGPDYDWKLLHTEQTSSAAADADITAQARRWADSVDDDAEAAGAASATEAQGPGAWNQVTGFIVGWWQIILTAFIAGYVLNLFLAGGMLTYLCVREDDYWDDEDLEDLDQLAKELEEEAKREEEAAGKDSGETGASAPSSQDDGEKQTSARTNTATSGRKKTASGRKKTASGRKKTASGRKKTASSGRKKTASGRKKTDGGGKKSGGRKKTE